MQTVKTLWGLTPVNVIKDLVEMGTLAQVYRHMVSTKFTLKKKK